MKYFNAAFTDHLINLKIENFYLEVSKSKEV